MVQNNTWLNDNQPHIAPLMNFSHRVKLSVQLYSKKFYVSVIIGFDHSYIVIFKIVFHFQDHKIIAKSSGKDHR